VKWRVVLTDSEDLTGIAPECPRATEPEGPHDIDRDEPDLTARYDEHGVYDCCPHPHIECWSPLAAELAANGLTGSDAEPCS